jgi:hypothetical protein
METIKTIYGDVVITENSMEWSDEFRVENMGINPLKALILKAMNIDGVDNSWMLNIENSKNYPYIFNMIKSIIDEKQSIIDELNTILRMVNNNIK